MSGDIDIPLAVRMLLSASALALTAKLLSDLIAERGQVWTLWKTTAVALTGLVLLSAALAETLAETLAVLVMAVSA